MHHRFSQHQFLGSSIRSGGRDADILVVIGIEIFAFFFLLFLLFSSTTRGGNSVGIVIQFAEGVVDSVVRG